MTIFGAMFTLSMELLSEVRNLQCLHFRMMSIYNGFHWNCSPTIAKESCWDLKIDSCRVKQFWLGRDLGRGGRKGEFSYV